MRFLHFLFSFLCPQFAFAGGWSIESSNPAPEGHTGDCNFKGNSKPKPKAQSTPLPPAPVYTPPKLPPMPKIPDPVKPDPVAQSGNFDVSQAEQQQREDARKRKGLRKTLLAGETGQKSSSPVTGSTLLG